MKQKTEKPFDAVKSMRTIRDAISQETADMDFAEFQRYLHKNTPEKYARMLKSASSHKPS